MKTKEELLERVKKINEYNAIKGYTSSQNNYSRNEEALILNNFEESNDMCNFTLEFLELLKKYNVRMQGSNGMLETFEFSDAPERYLGICPFWRWLQLTDEEMDAKIEEARLEKEQKNQKNVEEPQQYNNLYNTIGIDKSSINEEISEDEELLNDTEIEDYDEDEDEDDESEMYCYDASGAFTADIELNVGKIETNDSDEDLIQKCIDLVINKIESDDLYIETDVEEMDENATIEVLEDGTTLVKINNVEFSVRVDIMAYNLDNANDDRWGEFYDKINPLEYLQNIRDEYVSEAD